mmetsp:Transcript_10517/g.30971  ORF Transcript_10517/g.30971 Transcript_10517/m.30971 type:complete len:238 (-) Transcript_10517:93-806(-)|eukprot:CAMPEP_0113531704 /NCGR_PEP_ID=MMETSP0015_2-20120614/3641_1 /TAXON_ID=2838 /ORGANISM="Odontella" /LENGTH=237 /DNA_ID=CAMNT_0000430563 /DNA_START=8 /DNA_END=721 /DNA_ORIENTATION=- /assembly_acc=CAM_ASM_000160
MALSQSVPSVRRDEATNGCSESIKNDMILALTGKKKWETLFLYLRTPKGQEEAGRISKRRFGKFKLNILHALCWFSAPLEVIELIPRQDVLASEKDACHQTALHLCILHSQSIEVIRHVMDVNPGAVFAKDDEGRTPLLCLCAQIEADENIFEGATALINHYDDLVKLLVEKRPSSVLEEDGEGMSAIERAICGGSPRKVIKSMQTAAVEVGRSRQQTLSCASFSYDDSPNVPSYLL